MARLGLLLIGVVAWATEQLSQKKDRLAHYLLAGAAHLLLAGVKIIGSVVDGIAPAGRITVATGKQMPFVLKHRRSH